MVCLDNVLFINVDCGSCTIVLLLWKTNLFFFLNVVFFVKVIRFLWRGSYFRIISSLCGKVHGKTLCSIHCWTLAKFTENTSLNCQLISNVFIQIHSFCRVALLWSFLVLMGGKTDGQDLFLTKAIGFDFLLFNNMLLSVWIRVQTFNSLLINWIGNFIF